MLRTAAASAVLLALLAALALTSPPGPDADNDAAHRHYAARNRAVLAEIQAAQRRGASPEELRPLLAEWEGITRDWKAYTLEEKRRLGN